MNSGQSRTQIRINLKKNYKQDDNESDYQPQISKPHSKRVKNTMKKVRNKKKQNYNFSTWNLQENILYKDFLLKNAHLFSLKKKQRRAIKINFLISKYVKTRSSDQCRSHHQKMLIYHYDIPTIVKYIQSLEEKKDKTKIYQLNQSEELEITKTSTLEMKEIEDVKYVCPSLWDFMVDEIWQNL